MLFVMLILSVLINLFNILLGLILAHDHPLPERIFTAQNKGRFMQCTAELALNELHNHLKRWANFELVRDQSYVCLLHEENTERYFINFYKTKKRFLYQKLQI